MPRTKTAIHEQSIIQTSSIVFIAGCGRSGTTYLRTLLDAHPDIFIPSESLFLIDYLRYSQGVPKQLLSWLFFNEPQLKAWYRGQTFGIDDIQHTISHIHEYEAQRNGAKIWGQKTPRFVRHMPLFNAYFPNIKWVLVYRDPRAVVASMLQSKRHTYVLASACRRWLKDNRPIIQILKSAITPDNVYIIKYEDLIDDFELSLTKIFEFLAVPPIETEQLYRSVRLPELKGSRFEDNTIRSGIAPQTRQLNAWMQVLTRKQIERIEKRCDWQMNFLGYAVAQFNGRYGTRGDVNFFDWSKYVLILLEYLQKWPQYLFHTLLRKVLLLSCHCIKKLTG